MSDTESERLGAMIDTVRGMRGVTARLTRQIDQCLQLLALDRDNTKRLPRGDPEVFRVILTMIHMVGISGHSILKLTDEIDLGVKDAYPVARSIVEETINICFIMAKGRDAAAKAERHAEVRSYRDLKRQWEVDGTKIAMGFSGQIPDSESARLEALTLEFTSKRGAEKNWTDQTLKKRLSTISRRFSSSAMIALNTSAFGIYRHASEVIHGSYFSARYFWGQTLPGQPAPTTTDSLKLTLLDHQFQILMATVSAYVGLIECFATYAGVPQLADEANAQLKRLRKLPAISEALKDAE